MAKRFISQVEAARTRSRWHVFGYEETWSIPVDQTKQAGLNEEERFTTITFFRPASIMWVSRSKYEPHQGKRETSRRVRQANRK